VKFAVDIPFVRLLGFDLQVFEQGHAVIEYDPQPDHRNAFGATHGGALMTLLDVTMASAARSVQLDCGLVTIEMKTSFMQTARGRLKGKGSLVHRSASLAFTQATVIDETGQVCAQAMATFKYVRPKVDGMRENGSAGVTALTE
jgi:uncharacterized protein (TIGR00369 family)